MNHPDINVEQERLVNMRQNYLKALVAHDEQISKMKLTLLKNREIINENKQDIHVESVMDESLLDIPKLNIQEVKILKYKFKQIERIIKCKESSKEYDHGK